MLLPLLKILDRTANTCINMQYALILQRVRGMPPIRKAAGLDWVRDRSRKEKLSALGDRLCSAVSVAILVVFAFSQAAPLFGTDEPQVHVMSQDYSVAAASTSASQASPNFSNPAAAR